MLTDAELLSLFESRGTPECGRARIRRIRTSPPARAVRTNKMSGKTRYAPVKMPFVIETEATATEYAAAVEYDHDPDVIEFYSQVEALQIEYLPEGGGRKVRFPTTPDFFCIRSDRFVFVECKTEDQLSILGQKSPLRYQRDVNGCWRSPPGEIAAKEFGCSFEVRSTTANNWALIENLEILKDFVEAPCLASAEARTTVVSRLSEQGWASLFDLVHMAPTVSADALYSLIARKELFFPITKQRLTDQERSLVFRDLQTYEAHSTFISSDRGRRPAASGAIEIEAGALFTWDGKPWQIVNSGATRISIRRLDAGASGSEIADLSQADFLGLVGLGRIQTSKGNFNAGGAEGEDIVRRAPPKALSKAQAKYSAIQALASGNKDSLIHPLRTLYLWQRQYRDAEERYGNGFIGLIPRQQGNRKPKASLATLRLADQIIENDWETIRHKHRNASYGRYAIQAEKEGISKISYVSFCKRVKARSGFTQHAKRFGEKASYDQEPQQLEIEYTTPRHGVRPWHVAHIDHTPLPLKFVHSRLSSIERTVWLTILMDANTRKILAYYLTFDEPSYRSCMMVLRDCVRRHNRVPQIVVCDRGPEFSSTYWEQQLAYVHATKRDRRASKARSGTVCERIFNTSQSQLVKALLGSTDIVEDYFRRISPEFRPERHATWTLDRFDAEFQRYLDEIYHVNPHGGLGMSPNEAWAIGLKSHGTRSHIAIPYDKQFLIQSCPAAHRGTARVSPAGVKINYRWFKCQALAQPGVVGTSVPARYDPFNAGIAYVFVRDQWHECRSEMYAVFSEHTERQIHLMTEHLRMTDRMIGQSRPMTAERMAAFLMSLEEGEAEGIQLRADREAKRHRLKINTPQRSLGDDATEDQGSDVLATPVVGRILGDL